VEVLGELGYDEAAIKTMLDAGSVKTAPGGTSWLL
jgi:hypothetical protein